ncbi:MAG: outer membrane beta-barrel protein [Leptospirales bacterium]
MKNQRYLLFLAIVAILLIGKPLFGQYEEKAYHPNIRMGFWFGPVAPFPGTEMANRLGTYLGGGVFGRMNIPAIPFEAELGISYNSYRSDTTAELTTIPLYLAILYRIPIRSELDINLKVGGGASYAKNFPEKHQNILPLLYTGFDLSFAAGRKTRIGLKVDYNLLYEKHLDIPANAPSDYTLYNGHMLNIGLMLSFRFNND